MCACFTFVRFIVILAGVLGSSLGQIIPQSSAPVFDRYTTLVPVNIRCTNDASSGLTCNAVYPDQCKEQWNFPNPCTPDNFAQNKTRFVHPYDTTKFLMCGGLKKLYVIQCPQYEVYHAGCEQCVSRGATLTASCETPLPQIINNPCSREAILSNELFFTFPGNISKFIHCDIWGKAWERICTPGEVWSQFDVACVNPVHYNPCVRRTSGPFVFYPHPCDPFKYLRCGVRDEALEVACEPGTAFSDVSQKCEPIEMFNSRLENICGEFQFGFRAYRSGPTARLTISQQMDFQNNVDKMLSASGNGILGFSVSQEGLAGASDSQQGMAASGSNQGGMGASSSLQGTNLEASSGSQLGIMGFSGSQQGMTQAAGSQTDVSGSQVGIIDTSGSQQGILDVSGPQQGMMDVSGSQQGMLDVSGSQQGMMDVSASHLGMMGIDTLENLTLGMGIVMDKQQTGITNMINGGQQNPLNDILSVWRKNVAKSGLPRPMDSRPTVDLGSGPGITDTVSGKPGKMSVESVHPSQLKEYVYSDIKYSEPCTVENLSNRRTHFRLKGDPHSFLQCDNAGKMYKMPCSTNKRDWFDVYTMTCVDGPVHVDNRVPRG